MFNKKRKIEVVPESQYTDFSSRLKAEGDKYAGKGTFIASLIPMAISVPIVIDSFSNNDGAIPMTIPEASPEQLMTTAAQVITPPPVSAPYNVLADPTQIPVSSPEVIQTGFIADKSLEAIANVMDPLIDILVAISFPVASVIMVGACFFFMFGNSEKAWDMIMKAGLGYVLIQMSPLFLEMLKTVGNAV